MKKDDKMTITPQQAFDAIRVLYPNAKSLHDELNSGGAYFWNDGVENHRFQCEAEIDWPEGVAEWPVPVVKWRTAAVDDVNPRNPVPCRARDSTQREWHQEYVLLGVDDRSAYPFTAKGNGSQSSSWKYCEVIDAPKLPSEVDILKKEITNLQSIIQELTQSLVFRTAIAVTDEKSWASCNGDLKC